MKNLFKYLFLILFIQFVLNACTVKPSFPNEPKIEFVSLSKNTINKSDTLWIKLNFEDGDGNLGKDPSLSSTCGKGVCDLESDTSCFKDPFYGAFLIDTRDTCLVQFLELPDFEPNGKVKAVSGELLLVTPPIPCKLGGCPTCTEDTVVYRVVVRDFDGNFSNEVFTDSIYISCN